MNFEICAVNIQSAIAAQAAGAHRIELCSALDVGGLTPSIGLVRAVIRTIDLPVHVLIRPREGDFCYSNQELDIMLDDIQHCRLAGAAGVVVGALTPDGGLDLPKMKAMKDAAKELPVTCHRAFDFTTNPSQALEQLVDMGFERVLSSGQADNAFVGRYRLKEWVDQAAGRIAVMPGGGINAQNILSVMAFTGAKEVHFTGKFRVETQSTKALPGLESWHWESSLKGINDIISAYRNGPA